MELLNGLSIPVQFYVSVHNISFFSPSHKNRQVKATSTNILLLIYLIPWLRDAHIFSHPHGVPVITSLGTFGIQMSQRPRFLTSVLCCQTKVSCINCMFYSVFYFFSFSSFIEHPQQNIISSLFR